MAGNPDLPTPALAIRNLRVDYGEFTAVDDLTLTLQPGQIFGLAGPNGAGKTSTIRVIATLLEPTYGEVEVCSVDLFHSRAEAHALLGYMPDLAPVIPDLKVWEFLDLYARSYGLSGQSRRERIEDCLEAVKLIDKRNALGQGLSRGMMQRIVLAKTLLHRPRLLLLDEPASGMDPVARRDLRVVLERLASDGATIIVSSHILSELSGMCTSVGVMHQGTLHLQPDDKDSAATTLISDVRLRVLGETGGAAAWLSGLESVSAIRSDGQEIAFAFTGGPDGRAQLLREAIAAGFEVTDFSSEKRGIESTLMTLIDGAGH